jgi:hypothetical protein
MRISEGNTMLSFDFRVPPVSGDARVLAERMKIPPHHRALDVLGTLRFRVIGLGRVFALSTFEDVVGGDMPCLPPDTPCLGAIVWSLEDLPPSGRPVLEQMIRNGAAMAGLERAINFFKLLLADLSGFKHVRALFPGRDVPLNVQGRLANLLDSDSAGISLKEDLLVPEDSLSTLLIPACHPEDTGLDDQCGSCGDLGCPYRRS